MLTSFSGEKHLIENAVF